MSIKKPLKHGLKKLVNTKVTKCSIFNLRQLKTG